MNLHRQYGPLLYPKFTKLWKLEGLFGIQRKIGIGTEPGVGGFNKKKTILRLWEHVANNEFDAQPPVTVLRKPIDARWTQDMFF